MTEISSISGKLPPTTKIYLVTVPKIQTIKLRNNLPKIIKTENGSTIKDPIIFSANYEIKRNKAKIP